MWMVLFGSSMVINVVLGIIVRNFLIKSDKLTAYNSRLMDFIEQMQFGLSETINAMRDIDIRGRFSTNMNEVGAFESDDSVGTVFKDMVRLVSNLHVFLEDNDGVN